MYIWTELNNNMEREHTAADNEVNIIAAIGLHELQNIVDWAWNSPESDYSA